MCWNAEVSLQSFSIGILAILLAYTKGLPLPAVFFCLTITFMQFIEYIVWSNYEDRQVNYFASAAAVALLWLQPVAAILTSSVEKIPLFLGGYLGLTLLGYATGFRIEKRQLHMYRAPNGHLSWGWLQKDKKTTAKLLVYFIFLFFPLFLSRSWTLLSLSLATLGLSLWSFSTENTWGSMWCWIVNYGVVGVCAKQIFLDSK